MIILIYGEDTFRVQEKVRQMKTAFLEKFDSTGLNTHAFPTESTGKLEASEILQSLCSFPFFGKKRMVLICDLIGSIKKAEQTVWIDGFSRMPESTIAVLWETKDANSIEKKPFFKELEKLSEVHKYTFSQMQGKALEKWIQQRVEQSGGKIEECAKRALVERVGSDLWKMLGEINKLIGFVNGELITKSNVESLVLASFEGKVFELMDAISKKQTSVAVRLLAEERASGINEHYLLTMIGRQVRILLGACSLIETNKFVSKEEVASSLDIHPYVAQKALDQVKFFAFNDLVAAHELLYDFDQKIKIGRINVGLSVDLIIDRLMQPSTH